MAALVVEVEEGEGKEKEGKHQCEGTHCREKNGFSFAKDAATLQCY